MNRPDVNTYYIMMKAAGSQLNSSGRLISLDVFRGATIAFMILVNNQGIAKNAYGAFSHGSSTVITPADWVFPFFLFIVGVAMPFSFGKILESLDGKKGPIYLKVIKRTLLLFGIGMLLNICPE